MDQAGALTHSLIFLLQLMMVNRMAKSCTCGVRVDPSPCPSTPYRPQKRAAFRQGSPCARRTNSTASISPAAAAITRGYCTARRRRRYQRQRRVTKAQVPCNATPSSPNHHHLLSKIIPITMECLPKRKKQKNYFKDENKKSKRFIAKKELFHFVT